MVTYFDKQLHFKAESERLLTLYKTFLVVEVLQTNSKGSNVLDVAKASFFEFVISDHNLTRRVLSYFKPDIKLDDRYYVKDIYEYKIYAGNVFEDTEIRKNIAILCNGGLLRIAMEGNEIYLRTDANLSVPQNSLVILWRDSLLKLKPLMSKSITQLYKGLLEGVNV